MNGLRFYRKSVNSTFENGMLSFHHSELDANQSDFNYIFKSIFSYLQNKYLLNDLLPIFDPNFEDKIFDKYIDYIVQDNENYTVSKASILDLCGQSIPEFEGNSIIIVDDIPDIMEWVEYCEYEQKNADSIFCVFSNWDGIFWDIYTNEKIILESLLSSHENDSNLEIYHVDSKLDYPDPIRTKSQLKSV